MKKNKWINLSEQAPPVNSFILFRMAEESRNPEKVSHEARICGKVSEPSAWREEKHILAYRASALWKRTNELTLVSKLPRLIHLFFFAWLTCE